MRKLLHGLCPPNISHTELFLYRHHHQIRAAPKNASEPKLLRAGPRFEIEPELAAEIEATSGVTKSNHCSWIGHNTGQLHFHLRSVRL
jgi:hypothetical protein